MNRELIASLIFAIGCFIFFLIDVPGYDKISDIRSVIKDRQALLNERIQERENFKKLTAQSQARKADTDKIGIFLPDSKQIDQVISSLQTSSQDNGVQLIDISVSPLEATSEVKYHKIFISLSLAGNYTNFVNFLSEIEKNLRIFDVKEISIGQNTAQAQTPGQLTFSVKIEAYNLK